MDLYDYSLLTIFLVSLLVILAFTEAGWRLGLKADGRGSASVGTLTGAMLGLLALMIGFTFSMVVLRFEARRDAVLKEANAISTAALRARLLPDAHRAASLKLIRDYLQVRIDIAQVGSSLIDMRAAVDRSNALQEELWQQAKAIAANDRGAVTALFVQSLNAMFEAQETRLAGLRNRVPNIVSVMLYLLAAFAVAFASYVSALEPKRTRAPTLITGLLIAAVIYLILDLDRPTSGFITNNQQPIMDVAASMRSYSD